MKTRISYSAALVATLTLLASSALGAGFANNELSARPLGMSNAVTAVADQPSAIAFNPAGLATQEGFSVEGAVSLIAPIFGYDTAVPSTGEMIRADAKRDLFLVPSVYASYRLHERVAAGVGVYFPFGLAVNWDKTVGDGVPWWGRSLIEEVDVKTIFINPTVAFKLHDRLFLGAGMVISQSSVTLQRAVMASNDPADDITVRMSGDDLGFGGTAGLLLKLIPDRLNFGFGYRSAVRLTFEGAGAFTKGGSSAAVPAGLRTQLVDGRIEAPLELPHVFLFGLAVFPLPGLTLGVNLDLITWSTYKDLTVNFLDNPELTTSERKDWENSFTVRVGAEYALLEGDLRLRGGFIYDVSPVPNDTVGPELPDVNRYLISLGLGYSWKGIRADLAYQFLISGDEATAETAPLVGVRSAKAHIGSFGLSYAFGI